jgi:hypothetical protein
MFLSIGLSLRVLMSTFVYCVRVNGLANICHKVETFSLNLHNQFIKSFKSELYAQTVNPKIYIELLRAHFSFYVNCESSVHSCRGYRTQNFV